jgi:hypothetical protein
MVDPNANDLCTLAENGNFTVEFRETYYRCPFDVELIVRCGCGTANMWNHRIPGVEMMTFLRGHRTPPPGLYGERILVGHKGLPAVEGPDDA